MDLARAGFGTVEPWYDAVAQQCQLPRLPLDAVELALDLVNLIPHEPATKYGVVPELATDEEFSLAVSDPTQISIFDWLARQHKRQVTVVIAPE